MRNLTIGDILLGLTDLFENKKELFLESVSGRIYGPLLETNWQAIKELPEEITGGLPVAKDLAAADAKHDGLGGAIWYLCQAYEHHPGMSDEVRAAAKQVREAFVPGLKELERSYADEAAAAQERRAHLDELGDALNMLPAAGTLKSWVTDFLDSAGEIEELLNQREAYKSIDPETRNKAPKLRAGTVDLLNRCRLALEDELKVSTTKLPEDYIDKVYGYFDELERLHDQGTAP